MIRSLIGASALALTLGFSTGCGGGAAADPSTPESAIMIPVNALKNNDIKGALTSLAPAEAMSKMEKEWNQNKNDFADDVGAMLPMISADNAVETMGVMLEAGMKEVKPAELAAQIRQMGAFAPMMAPTPETGKQLATIAESAAKFIETAGVDDVAKAKKALGVISAGLRDAGLTSADSIKALDLNGILGKSGQLLGTAKEAAAIYGLDVQAILNSFSATAKDDNNVSVSATVLGQALNFDVPVQKQGDSWMIAGMDDMK